MAVREWPAGYYQQQRGNPNTSLELYEEQQRAEPVVRRTNTRAMSAGRLEVSAEDVSDC